MTRTKHTVKTGRATCPHCKMLVETVIGRFTTHTDIEACIPPIMTVVDNVVEIQVFRETTCKGSGKAVNTQ
jgi:hypothetical protein